MEVSSHALALSRVEGIDFDVAVFTNLTQDHLDFHLTHRRLPRRQAHLFALLAAGHKPTRTAVVNADDASGLAMVADLPPPHPDLRRPRPGRRAAARAGPPARRGFA